ncbi:unnamed protein product [Linum tenue]|uniref:Uncharacterized protein n=1 Tax=Linum tenue TaxID=586396 RepID=A0AAV0IK90_9ROSI|nr:unnamed protein product [Linum tenue]
MGISKTEIDLRRLLDAAPRQQNQAKLVHYVASLREQLENLGAERTPDGLPRVSKTKVNDYSERIEAIASKLAAAPLFTRAPTWCSFPFSPIASDLQGFFSFVLLSTRRALNYRQLSNVEDRSHDSAHGDSSTAQVKLDAAAHMHIEKHRKLQEDLTDEMVVLARQLKESSLMMHQSVQGAEKVLDSTEQAIEQSLATTGHANVRAAQVVSQSSKTSCLTWLLLFAMICIFVMVVLLIRAT